MRRKPGITSVFLLIGLLLFPSLAPGLVAQTAPPPPQQTAPPPPPTPQQLDQLLAPIALYPDQLLAQITTASTNPQEILDVTNWLAQNPNLTGAALTDAAQKQGFDPAFLALVAFPTVLQMMATTSTTTPPSARRWRPTRPRWPHPSSACAVRPMPQGPSAPTNSRRLRCSRSPINPSTSFSPPIRRSSTSRNTTPQLSTLPPAPAPSSRPRSSPSE